MAAETVRRNQRGSDQLTNWKAIAIQLGKKAGMNTRMKNYRRGVIAFVIAGLLVLICGAIAQAYTTTRVNRTSGDDFRGTIMKGTSKHRKVYVRGVVTHQSVRRSTTGWHHFDPQRFRAITSFEGKRMGCASGSGVFDNGYYGARIHLYIKDGRGRNWDRKFWLPCQNDTYVSKSWSLRRCPIMYHGGKWKANWTLDVRGGHNDLTGTTSGYFRY